MSDVNVTVTNAGTTSVAVQNGSTVSATVGNGGAVNVSTGTISPGNATVVSGTLAINSVTTLAAGSQAYVKNDTGTAYAAKLDIGIPAGPATTVSVGSTTTLESGNATVTGTTSGNNLTLAFGIPRGAAGAAGTNGTNGTNGVTPTISASATTLSAGSSATVTATPSNGGANVALAFGIPSGAAGSSGPSLSDATPSALGTASAGTSTTASRSDHVHAVPVISYANLTNVPIAFAPSAHTHTLADISQSSATAGQVPTWSGTAWAAASLPTASSSVLGAVKIGSGLSISSGVLSATGGSANIVEATTVASFPATGASGTLYVATDASRGYRWDSSGVYVELGPGGVRGDLVPTAPEITSLSLSGLGVQVGWTASSSPATLPVLNYVLQYATLTGSTLSAWTTFVRSSSAATSVSVISLGDGAQYKFRVCGVNAVGQGPWSSTSASITNHSNRFQYWARYASTSETPAGYSTTGVGVESSPFVAYLDGGSVSNDTRLWLLVNTTGTLSYTVTANCDGNNGGALFLSSASPVTHIGYGGPYDMGISTGYMVSSPVTGTGTSSGTVSVTAGQYVILRYAKPSNPSGTADRITATLSIS